MVYWWLLVYVKNLILMYTSCPKLGLFDCDGNFWVHGVSGFDGDSSSSLTHYMQVAVVVQRTIMIMKGLMGLVISGCCLCTWNVWGLVVCCDVLAVGIGVKSMRRKSNPTARGDVFAVWLYVFFLYWTLTL